MSLSGPFTAPFTLSTQSFQARAHSGQSLDEIDDSSFAMSFAAENFERRIATRNRTMSQGTVEEDDVEWEVLNRKIESCVRLDTTFFEYPAPETLQSPPTSGNMDEDEQTGTKVFFGGMRFELVQLGRHMVAWVLETACGVKIPAGRILIHRKARNGKVAAPTGCASVYVAQDADVRQLIAMNQRIFCGEKGLHVAASPDRMEELIKSRRILDVVDGKVRGPTHPIVIEKAYNNSNAHTPLPNSTSPSTAALSNGSALTDSFGRPPPAYGESGLPVYYRYDGDQKTIIAVESTHLEKPTELFVGGLCYEATRTFVAWLFQLVHIPVHPHNVTLYVDAQTGIKRGCAQVRMEEQHFVKASAYTRRMLCDACGVYIADSPQGIQALQANRDPNLPHRGPTHAVVIERRRNVKAGGPPAIPMIQVPSAPSVPPPPQPLPVQHPGGFTVAAAQPSKPPPPPSYKHAVASLVPSILPAPPTV